MPTNRRYRRRNRAREPLPKWILTYLSTGEDQCHEAGWTSFSYFNLPVSATQAWVELREELLLIYVDKHPGCRPWAWWGHDAPRAPLGMFRGWCDGRLPAPRLRLGGVGTPSHEVLAYVPDFSFGIPVNWITDIDVATWPRLAGHAIDPNDPPTFESEASYLRRHRLLGASEARYADFEPEPIIFSEDDPDAD